MLMEERRVTKSNLMFTLLYVLHASITSIHAADTVSTNYCDRFGVCGPFGSCDIYDSSFCECLEGFEPTSPDQWRVADQSQGCRRTTLLQCEPGEGFNKYSNLNIPNTRNSWYNKTMTLVDCEKMCKSNCSCSAYMSLKSDCLLWYGDLFDVNTNAGYENTLYIRMAPSELDSTEKGRRSSVGRNPSNRTVGEVRSGRRVPVIVPVGFVVFVILVSKCLLYRFNKKRQLQQEPMQPRLQLQVFFGKKSGEPGNMFGRDPEFGSDDGDLNIKLFGLSTLHKATNNFSVSNKLGEGGFGPVYKGVLEDGQVIAVKRLATTSTQGLQEFKNEVISISKLQHRNLVKLLGYCVEGAEKMLIYEYMSNKSLDSFLFDETQRKLLDWPARYRIINRIARGLLYLHQDSRLRIIHRDLKVSNILLDSDMNPKISDFGMARTFGGNQIEANTKRVVGTYGYMAPEYATRGIFSIKSDVYSFGVLVLEIVCGEKNTKFVCKEHCDSLTGYAWGLHNEGRTLYLVDKCLGELVDVPQIIRSIHIGLLCVQHNLQDRPTMTSVIKMLNSDNPLPSPKVPGFYIGKAKQEATQPSSLYGACSNNELTISMLNGR